MVLLRTEQVVFEQFATELKKLRAAVCFDIRDDNFIYWCMVLMLVCFDFFAKIRVAFSSPGTLQQPALNPDRCLKSTEGLPLLWKRPTDHFDNATARAESSAEDVFECHLYVSKPRALSCFGEFSDVLC